MITIGLIFRERQSIINKLHLLIFAVLFFCSCHSISGQQECVKYDSLTQQNVYVFVEKMPDYKGGDKAFLNDFMKNFHYSFQKNEDIQTKLRFQFVISKEGQLIGARINNKKTDELTNFEKAGLKALNLLQDWQPGEYNGKSVNVLITKTIHVDLRSAKRPRFVGLKTRLQPCNKTNRMK
jgi:hypothetical protein